MALSAFLTELATTPAEAERAGVLYAGYEDLIRMKSSAGRDENLADIAKLLAARGEPQG
jgi:hypothetical protein